MKQTELKPFLDSYVKKYNTLSFIKSDPISIPHCFSRKEDIEIAGFLSSTIAWGYRPTIVANTERLMNLMDNDPYAFVIHYGKNDTKKLLHFVHRTFNSEDLVFFLSSLRNIYKNHGGLENVFYEGYSYNMSIKESIINFRKIFFESDHFKRSEKHISDPGNNSAAKRINLFLRWMVRRDESGVDFGIWNKIKPSQLMCPLDLHSARTARKLGLLERKQNDWKAVEELTLRLRTLDANDPVKYDYALFGLGIYEHI